MSLDWVNAGIPDKKSARKAIQGGVAACAFIAIVDGIVGIYSVTSHNTFATYNGTVLVDGALFAIVAWRLWKNSRAWSVVGLLLEGLEIADKIARHLRTVNIVTIVLFLAILNAARATFALRRYTGREKLSPVSAESNKPLG